VSHSWRRSIGTSWHRWQRFAHRATEVQSRLVLFLLYFAFVTPMALVMRIVAARRRSATSGTWQSVQSAPESLESAKNQF
jgi:hypothetical protein